MLFTVEHKKTLLIIAALGVLGALLFVVVGCGGDDLVVGATPDASSIPTIDAGGGGSDSNSSSDSSSSSSFNVTGAASIGSTRVTVTFDAPPNPTQAALLSSYAVPGLTFSGTPSIAGNVVTLTTSAQEAKSYTLTVTGVTRASDGKPLGTGTATFEGRAPFNVTSATSTNNITVTVTFDAPPTAAQATTLANYSVPGLTLTGTPTLNGNTVTMTTSAQSAQLYTIMVSNVTRANDSEPLTNASATFNGVITFNVASAAATRNTAMTVTFDALPNAAEAVVLANYNVPGLTLSAPVLNGNVLTLTTSSQSAQSYTVTVSNVTRAADAKPLVTTTATFQGRTAFNVQGATSLHATSISVTFDAPPDNAQATNAANYMVTGTPAGLTLSAPQLVGNTVTFTTTPQSAQSYTVTVANVTRASDAEVLATSTAIFTGRLPPGTIVDLTGQAKSPTSIDLQWTAPAADPPGTTMVTGYELRYSKTPITTVAEFLAATSAPAGAPMASGQMQNANVAGLDPGTTYHFVVRAVDSFGNVGALSNDAAIATKARAKVLITEVAVANTETEGFDFVELYVTQAGSAEGITIKQQTTVLYTLGALDLVIGDRVVVHAAGAPAPVGSDQEDISKNKTGSISDFSSGEAYDVYATTSGLTGTDNLILVTDAANTTIQDAVAISNRDNDASATAMTAWAAVHTAGAWTFGALPVDGGNDCDRQRDAVNIAQPAEDLACGGFATGYAKGFSINRSGTTDTNSKADWYVAAQTTGTINVAPPPAVITSAIATSATTVDLVFDRELTQASVTTGAFTIAGLTVSLAMATNVNTVTLTTSAQGGGAYQVDVAASVTTTYGTLVVPPSARFCAFTALPALVALNEVSPNLSGGSDLVELKVTRGGPLSGYQLRANPTAAGLGTLLATLPAICALDNDIVVVHLIPPAGTASTSETLSIAQHPLGTFAANYDGAYDVLGGNSGIGFTSQVLAIRNLAGTFIEAAAFSDMSATASTATYLNSLAFIQSSGLWLPPDCGGLVCSDATNPTAKGVAASWVGVSSTTPTGASVSRSNVATQASSWAVGASSFGL